MESYALWWRDAGLHSAVSDVAYNWRDAPIAAPVTPAPALAEAEALRPAQRVSAPAIAPAPVSPAPLRAASPMPTDLVAFRAWLAENPAQPEAAWTGSVFLPPTLAQARLLLLVDMPDEGAADPSMPFAPDRQRFLAAMLASIGLAPNEAVLAPLAIRRPPGGLLDEPTLSALARRMRHYLALARPRAALILGDRTSRALGTAQGGPGGGNLTQINLDAGTIPAAALAGADLLMRRPAAKAASWQTLRLLRGVIAA